MAGQLNSCGFSSFLAREQKRSSCAQCFLPSVNSQSSFKFYNAFIYILVLILCAPHIQGEDGELCVVVPLQTPYLISYEEDAAPCTGCILPSEPSTGVSQFSRVHILQVDRPEDAFVEISLVGSSSWFERKENINKTRHALVLSSATRSTTFVISVQEPHLLQRNTFHIIMTGDVKVAVFSQSMDYTSVRKISWSPEDVFANAKKHFGFVTSFTRGSDANRISFSLDTSDKEKLASCSEDVSLPSPLASCKRALRQKISGCFHENMIGVQERDIHIIEVDGSRNASRSILLLVSGIASSSDDDQNTKDPSWLGSTVMPSSSSNSSIGVDARKPSRFPSSKIAGDPPSSESGIKSIRPLRRNLTIILISGRPTTWTLRVSNIQGSISLFVGDGDQVENTSSPGQNLSVTVKRIDLPKTFDGLILRVLTSIGPPLSYTIVKSPNLIRMVVPQKHVAYQTPLEHLYDKLPQHFDWDEAYALVKESVSVFCLENSAYVSLPLEVLKKIGGAEMFFNDRSCLTTRNATHLTISSKFTRCGFSKQQLDRNTELYTNFVHIEMGRSYHHLPLTSDDEDDFEGSAYGQDDFFEGKKIPVELVQCKKISSTPFHEELNGGSLRSEYRLQVFHDSDFRNAFKEKEFPITVPYEVTLHAKLGFWQDNSHMTSNSGIRLLIEECLLSKSAMMLLNPVTLIRKSCSVQPYVSMDHKIGSNDVAFHFQISNEYSNMEKIYLHCQAGVCSDGALPKPSVKKCVFPGIYCAKETLMSIFTNQAMGSLMKTVIAGPFIKQSSNEVHSGASVYAASDVDNQQVGPKFDNEGQTHVVIEGLSTEVVVGIAIAAFVIGVCLMATLWAIYMKTDPRHQMRPKANVPRNCGYDLSGHSGSSTPSSQAPMTA